MAGLLLASISEPGRHSWTATTPGSISSRPSKGACDLGVDHLRGAQVRVDVADRTVRGACEQGPGVREHDWVVKIMPATGGT